MSFDHDRPSSTDEWELTTVTDNDATVRVSKVGGGTLGRAYAGSWHYSYHDPRGHRLEEGSDLVTGSPTTHEEAAEQVADYFEQHDA